MTILVPRTYLVRDGIGSPPNIPGVGDPVALNDQPATYFCPALFAGLGPGLYGDRKAVDDAEGQGTAVDISGHNYLKIGCCSRGTLYPHWDTYANGGMRVLLVDSANNYSGWTLLGSDLMMRVGNAAEGYFERFGGKFDPNQLRFVIDLRSTPDFASGTLDLTDVVACVLVYNFKETVETGVRNFSIGGIYAFSEELVTGSESVVSLNGAIQTNDYQLTQHLRGFNVTQVGDVGPFYTALYGFTVGDGATATSFDLDNSSIIFTAPVASAEALAAECMHCVIDSARRKLLINTGPSDSFTAQGGRFAGVGDVAGNTYSIEVFGDESGSVDFTERYFSNASTLCLGHAVASDIIADGCERVCVTRATTLSGASIRGGSAACDGLTILDEPRDFSAVTALLNDNTNHDVTLGVYQKHLGINFVGHSFVHGSGGAYGNLHNYLDGRFTGVPVSSYGYAGETSSQILAHLMADVSASDLDKVQVLWMARNSVVASPWQTRQDIDAAVDYVRETVGHDLWLVVECPLTVAEGAAGAGDPGYDAVVAHNAWLRTRFGADRVVAAQDYAINNPDGTDHMDTAGYFRWTRMLGDVVAHHQWVRVDLSDVPAVQCIETTEENQLIELEEFTGDPAVSAKLPTDATADHTVAVWYKGTDSGYVIGRNDVGTSANRWGLRISTGGILLFTGASYITETVNPCDGEWHLLMYRVSGGTAQIAFDGQLLSQSMTAVQPTTLMKFQVCGSDQNGAWLPQGRYSSVSIWNSALSEADIAAVYNGGVLPAPSALPDQDNLAAHLTLGAFLDRFNRGWADALGNLDGTSPQIDSSDFVADVPGGNTTAAASTTYDLSGLTAPTGYTVKIHNVSDEDFTVVVAPSIATSVSTDGGTLTVVAQPTTTTIQLPNITSAGTTRYRVVNTTTGTELTNAVLLTDGIDVTYTLGTDYSNGDGWRITIANVSADYLTAKQELVVEGTFGPSTTVESRPVEMSDCAVYNSLASEYGYGGDQVTTYTADYVDNEVNLVVVGDFELGELYLWWKVNLATEQGIREFFGGLTPDDTHNFGINDDVVSIKLDETTGDSHLQADNRRLYRRVDDVRPVKDPPTGGGRIDVEWREPVAVATIVLSGQSVITGDIADVPSAVQDGLDSQGLTSTRAAALDNLDVAVSTLSTFDPSSDIVDANIVQVTGQTVDGSGSEADPWGPA